MNTYLLIAGAIVAVIAVVVISTNVFVRSTKKGIQNTLQKVNAINSSLVIQTGETGSTETEALDTEQSLCEQYGGSFNRSTRVCSPLYNCKVINGDSDLGTSGWQAGQAFKRTFNSECVAMKKGKSCSKGQKYEGSWVDPTDDYLSGLTKDTYNDCFGEWLRSDAYIGVYNEDGSSTLNENTDNKKYMRVIDRAYKNVDSPCTTLNHGDKIPGGTWKPGQRYRLSGGNNSCFEMKPGLSCSSTNFGDCYAEATRPDGAWKYLEVRPQGCAAADAFKKGEAANISGLPYFASRRWLPGEKWLKSNGDNNFICAQNKTKKSIRCLNLEDCFERAGLGSTNGAPLCDKIKNTDYESIFK